MGTKRIYHAQIEIEYLITLICSNYPYLSLIALDIIPHFPSFFSCILINLGQPLQCCRQDCRINPAQHNLSTLTYPPPIPSQNLSTPKVNSSCWTETAILDRASRHGRERLLLRWVIRVYPTHHLRIARSHWNGKQGRCKSG